MSLSSHYSKSTMLKALRWLNEQPHHWASHIKDSNIAVHMYLKSQKQNKESEFKKEIQQFIKAPKIKNEEPPGAVLRKALKPYNRASPPASGPDSKQEAPLFFPADQKRKESDPLVCSNQSSAEIFLDKRSLEALEAVKRELNMQSRQEALKLLIQMGWKSLQRCF